MSTAQKNREASVQNRRKGRRKKPWGIGFILFISLVVPFISFTATGFFINGWDRIYAPFLMNSEEVTPLVKSAFAEPGMAEAQTEITRLASDDDNDEYVVQAVLSPKRQAVIASGIDAKIIKLDLEDGDKFKKGAVLAEYDCSIDQGRLKEAQSRQRITEKQLQAYEKLINLESVSDMELLVARENNEQNLALISQIQGRLKACRHIAPFDGRVTRKMASQYEYAQAGRVLMDISSLDPLRAEFLIPSKWLRWLNVGTPLRIYIGETDRTYGAKIVAVHGEVDPVSQSVQVVAEMETYHEELLPGMSGQAVFASQDVRENIQGGFLGLMVAPPEVEDDGTKTE